MKAIMVEVEMRYKTEDGYVIQTDPGPIGQIRYVYEDKGKQKLGKSSITPAYHYPSIIQSFTGSFEVRGEWLFFRRGEWTYKLRPLGTTMIA
ncbi:hypothetical protein [Paenibacillus tepidiphilus]|uniref:hypothetical protein n=1 Tax=Paenibacillus tepidiphilus TaxID=2608683 RepID=UPI001238CAC0|nr:hypothetical protein [Paenibacillus tepidiphilus]